MNPFNDLKIFTDPLDNLSMSYGYLFVQAGQEELTALATIIFILYVLKYGWQGGLVQFFFNYVLLLVIATNLLRYYDSPGFLNLPLSVHQIMPAIASYLENYIKVFGISGVFDASHDILTALEAQQIGWGVQYIDLIVIRLLLWVLQAVAFASVALSYGMLGVFNLVGPLFIPWILSPRLSYLFWNWLQGIMQFSFYRVLAGALLYVCGATMLSFETSVLAGNYSLATVAAKIPELIVIVLADCWLLFRIGTMVSDLFKGSSSSASGFLPSVAGTAMRAAWVFGI